MVVAPLTIIAIDDNVMAFQCLSLYAMINTCLTSLHIERVKQNE